MAKSPSRTLAQLLGVFHNVTYYAKELRVFQDRGIDKFWHGYMAYRAAPMGRVEAPVVTATFYNFAPDLVEAAVPAVWDHVTPAEAIELRAAAILASLTNVYRSYPVTEAATTAAEAVLGATQDLSGTGRVLFASYQAQPVPEPPLLRLWHATTLWREFRGDGHNIALAAEGIDGIECHVLLAGRGIGNQQVIEKIRGWQPSKWEQASDRLIGRGLIDDTGSLTASGASLRRHIEDRTDELAQAPLDAMGPDAATRLIDQLTPVVGVLVESGVVPDRWPPPKPPR